MKKSFLVLVLLVCFGALDAFAQRRIGNTRDPIEESNGERNPVGRSGSAHPVEPPLPPQPIGDASPPCPAPPVPIIIIEQPPCTDHTHVVIIDQPNEEADALEVVLHDATTTPDKSGFDFSGDEIVSFNDEAADAYFSMSNEGPEFVVRGDEDIQDLGQADSFLELEAAASSEWSPTHRVHAEQDNMYVVWTWDNQYYKFRVVSLSGKRVSIEWKKMDKGSRIASNLHYRSGKTRRDTSLARFGK